MDNGSDAATADSVIQSDGRTTLESVTYDDPQNTYPHSPSLHSPRGIAQDGRESDFNENNDLAVRYVQGISAEVRGNSLDCEYVPCCIAMSRLLSMWRPALTLCLILSCLRLKEAR